MVTQKELASSLGVSRTTIARAINDDPNIKAETKEKILKKAKELGYEKNYAGSLLASKKKVVYCFTVESRNKYYNEQIKKSMKKAKKEYKHYNLEIIEITTGINDPKEQSKELEKLLKSNMQVDGIIIIPLDKEKILTMLAPYLDKINVVTISIFLDDRIAYVGTDYQKCGKIAAELLSKILLKNEKILVLDNGDDNISSKYYLNGFLEKAKDENLNIFGPIKKNGVEDSVEYIKEIYYTEKISSVFINRYAQDILLELPDEIIRTQKIVTTGIGNRIRKLINEKKILATIADDIYDTGYKAYQLMINRLYKNNGKKAEKIILEPQILLMENLK